MCFVAGFKCMTTGSVKRLILSHNTSRHENEYEKTFHTSASALHTQQFIAS